MSAVKTTYRECDHCHTRLLVVRGVPPLNYGEDPAGPVAVTIDSPRRGRFLGKNETPGPLERRYSVHECAGTKRAAQRGNWTSAIGDLHRAQRGRAKRAAPNPTGPGQTRLYPGDHR